MNDLCIKWIEDQKEDLLNVKVNDAYEKYRLYYNKFVYTNDWDGTHE